VTAARNELGIPPGTWGKDSKAAQCGQCQRKLTPPKCSPHHISANDADVLPHTVDRSGERLVFSRNSCPAVIVWGRLGCSRTLLSVFQGSLKSYSRRKGTPFNKLPAPLHTSNRYC
jgi:hypothetical protein